MSKILFSHSYFMRFDPKQWATAETLAETCSAAFAVEGFLLTGVIRVRFGRHIEGDIRIGLPIQFNYALGLDCRSL